MLGWMRETCQLLIVVPLPGFVSREDNSDVPACTLHTDATQIFCSLSVQLVHILLIKFLWQRTFNLCSIRGCTALHGLAQITLRWTDRNCWHPSLSVGPSLDTNNYVWSTNITKTHPDLYIPTAMQLDCWSTIFDKVTFKCIMFSGEIHGKLHHNLLCLHCRLHCLQNLHRPGK